MTKLVIFDLDGTLALDTHRVHHLAGEKPLPDSAWAAYFAACGDDEPNWPVVRFYQMLSQRADVRVQIWSGRSASVRELTEAWIRQHCFFPPALLLMRRADDRTHDDELKRQWLHVARSAGDEVELVLEDRARVVEMWRAEGVPCWQVAKGDF